MTTDQQLMVTRLAGLPEWDTLVDVLNEERSKLLKQVLSGVPDHDQYLRLTGEIRGIDLALNAPKRPASESTTNTMLRR